MEGEFDLPLTEFERVLQTARGSYTNRNRGSGNCAHRRNGAGGLCCPRGKAEHRNTSISLRESSARGEFLSPADADLAGPRRMPRDPLNDEALRGEKTVRAFALRGPYRFT